MQFAQFNFTFIFDIKMIYLSRNIEPILIEHLGFFPVTAILGPRQCGKSTLIKEYFSKQSDALYLDLEKESDRQKLQNPEQFFGNNSQMQICLDEVQRVPRIFESIRSHVDQNRRAGQFIILGSASRDLIRQSSESLAGRISYLELAPFILPEIPANKNQKELWMQGGFPDSLLASSRLSIAWRSNFIRTFMERDIPQIGFSIPSGIIGRLWKMLAHNHGQVLNLSNIGKSLGVSHSTVRSYVDLLNQTFMTREIRPWESNLKKRLVKTPKVYIRDSGILHSLLNISDFNSLMSHPVFGFSWEGFVIENVCSLLPESEISFYRTAHGEELDLIIKTNKATLAIECKVGDNPKPTRGFWNAIKDIKPDKTYIVTPRSEKYPIDNKVWVLGLKELIEEL